MKTYTLMLSKTFPATHPCAGQPTDFESKVLIGEKRHTLRSNYEFWRKRLLAVNEGKAVIVVKQWDGRPYYSTPREIFRLGSKTKWSPIYYCDSMLHGLYYQMTKQNPKCTYVDLLAKNDGLTLDQFRAWFNPKDLVDFEFEGIIIYFNDIVI